SAEPAPERVARGDWTTWIAGGAWEVRPLRPGDALVPLGGVGHRPVRRLLMDARVPRSDRAQYPIVARGETILWVPGICRSAADLPRPGTPAVRVDVTKHGESQADRRALCQADCLRRRDNRSLRPRAGAVDRGSLAPRRGRSAQMSQGELHL